MRYILNIEEAIYIFPPIYSIIDVIFVLCLFYSKFYRSMTASLMSSVVLVREQDNMDVKEHGRLSKFYTEDTN